MPDNPATPKRLPTAPPLVSIGDGYGPRPEIIDSAEPRRKDIRLAGRALRKRWNVPDQLMDGLVTQMALVALNPGFDTRARVAAAKVCQTAVAQNMAMDEMDAREEAAAKGVGATNVQINNNTILTNLTDDQIVALAELQRSLGEASGPGLPK